MRGGYLSAAERPRPPDGLAFFVVYYTQRDEIYYVPYRDMEVWWNRMEQGGRKSFTYEELDRSDKRRIRSVREMLVHYLEPLAEDLEERDEENE